MQRRLTVTALAVAAALLIAGALNPAGERVTRLRSLILHHHYVVDEPVAARGAVWLAFGVVVIGLLLVARLPSRSAWNRALALGGALVPLRILVDRAATPEPLDHAVGLFWLIPALGIQAALSGCRSDRKAPWGWFWSLGLLVRVPVVAVMAIATHWQLGTHYSLARIERVTLPGCAGPIVFEHPFARWFWLAVVPELLVWPMLTALGAAVTWHLCRRISGRSVPRPPSG